MEGTGTPVGALSPSCGRRRRGPLVSIARVPAWNRKCFARVGFEGSSWYPVLCFENGLMIFVFLGNAFRLSRDGI